MDTNELAVNRRQAHLRHRAANSDHFEHIAGRGTTEIEYHLRTFHALTDDETGGRTPAELAELHALDHSAQGTDPTTSHDHSDGPLLGSPVVPHLIAAHGWEVHDERMAEKSIPELVGAHDDLHATGPDLARAATAMREAGQNAARGMGGLADAMNQMAYGPDAARRFAEIRMETAELRLRTARRREHRDRVLNVCYLAVAGCFACFCLLILLVALASL